MTATAPDGTAWRVRRRWLPWRVRRRYLHQDLDPIGIVLFVLTFVLLILELVIALLVVLFTLLARVVLRRPWPVDASTDGPPPRRLTWIAPGFGTSGERVRSVAGAIESGGDPTAAADRHWVGDSHGQNLRGEPARALVLGTSGSLSGPDRVRWHWKRVDLRTADGREAQVESFLGERAHVLLTPGTEVPILTDPTTGTVLGIDVPACEAEAEERAARMGRR